jgi:hypothetical protein
MAPVVSQNKNEDGWWGLYGNGFINPNDMP